MLKKLKVCTLHIHNILNTHSWRWIFVSGACLLCVFPVFTSSHGLSGCRGGTRSENCWGCAVGHWKLDPKRSRGKWYFGAKKIEFCEDLYPKDRFCVGGWEKTPQKDRVWYPEGQKRGSKPRHICITHHIGSTPPREWIHSCSLILSTTTISCYALSPSPHPHPQSHPPLLLPHITYLTSLAPGKFQFNFR